MAKRVRAYLQYVDELLAQEEIADLDSELEQHLQQIAFFMHERLIHLIVTVTFAVLAMLVFLYVITNPGIMMFALFLALLVLLIPYISHYYLLENSVQKMYRQYDALRNKKKKAFQMER